MNSASRNCLAVILAVISPCVSGAQSDLGAAAWDSVGRIPRAPGTLTSGYRRYNLPRRDLTVHVDDVTVAPALALGAWAGFGGAPANAMMMGDLVLTDAELKPVLARTWTACSTRSRGTVSPPRHCTVISSGSSPPSTTSTSGRTAGPQTCCAGSAPRRARRGEPRPARRSSPCAG